MRKILVIFNYKLNIMTHQNKILLYLIVLFSFVSCNIPGINPNEVFYTIEGYIYEDCSLTPFANEPIRLWQDYDIGLLNDYGGVLDETTTDANGYFKFKYQPENLLPVLIQTDGGSPIIGAPQSVNIDDLIAYRIPTCNIQVSLNVINAYSEEDVLIIGNYATNSSDTIIGPFESGLLYTAINYYLLGMNYEGTSQRVLWYVNNPNDHHQTDFKIIEYCDDTTFVTVDIY